MKKAGTAAGQLNSWTDIRFQVERAESHHGPRITVRCDTSIFKDSSIYRDLMENRWFRAKCRSRVVGIRVAVSLVF